MNICLNFSKSSVDKEPRALVDDLIEQLLQSLHLSQDTFQNYYKIKVIVDFKFYLLGFAMT